jgi:hypothetical protein
MSLIYKNYILVHSKDQSTLEKVLFDLADLYYDTEYVYGIELYRRKGDLDSFLIQFSNNPDLDRFSYFVNYLDYPMDIENFKVDARGYYQTKDIIEVTKLKTGEWIMLFINPKDKDGDNVYIVNESHQNFIYDFGGRLKSLDHILEEFKQHNIDLKNYHHILNIFPSKTVKKQPKKTNRRIGQIIEDILVILGCLVFALTGYFMHKDSKDIGIALMFFFGLGFIFLLWKFINPSAYERIKNRKK